MSVQVRRRGYVFATSPLPPVQYGSADTLTSFAIAGGLVLAGVIVVREVSAQVPRFMLARSGLPPAPPQFERLQFQRPPRLRPERPERYHSEVLPREEPGFEAPPLGLPGAPIEAGWSAVPNHPVMA